MAYTPHILRPALPVLLLAGLSSCFSDLAPPGDLGGNARVVDRVETVSTQAAYPAPDNPVSQTAEAVDYLNTPNLAGVGNAPSNEPVSIYDEQVASMAAPVGSGVIVESDTSQPVVAGIGTDQLMVQNGQNDAADGNLWAGQPVVIGTTKNPPPEQQEVAFLRPTNPQMETAPQSNRPGVMPASEQNCRAQLRRLGAQFRDLPAINDGKSCRIDYPLKLESVSGGIDVKPDATLNCQMALTFAKWVKSELVPSARIRYFSGVKSIRQMSSYSCRRMNSSSRNPWSEHASGNAIDIGTISLKNGKVIDVRKKSFFSFREKGLLKAVRADSCKYFKTVLGPGSDVHHKDHFHFDLRHRKSGRRYCSL